MSNKTRKHIWPGALVLSLAIVGVLAAFVVLAGNPATTDAHGGGAAGNHCEGESQVFKNTHDALTPADHPKCADDTPPNSAPMAAVAGLMDHTVGVGGTITVDVSGHFTDEDGDTLTITAASSDTGVAGVSVSGNMVTVTIASGASDGDTATITVTANDGNGGTASDTFMVTVRVPAMAMVTLDGKTGGRTSGGGSDIQLTIPSLPMDMSVGSSIVIYLEDDFQEPDSIPVSSVYLVAEGGNAMQQRTTGRGARVYVTYPVKLSTSDYFDPDKKDIAIRVLVPDMCTNATDECEGPNNLHMGQKVSVVIESDSGIKNPSEAGTHSTGYALLSPTETEIPSRGNFTVTNTVATVAKISLSDVDNSRGYEMTVTGSGFNDGTTAAVYVLAASEEPACETIIETGTQVGGAIVASDDKAVVTFEVTAPTFKPGNVNYICMVDGEGRMSDTDVEDFNLQPSIKVVPSSVNSGDTVNVFAQDFPYGTGGFSELKIASRVISGVTGSSIRMDGSGEASFEVPGGLEGVLRIDARWGNLNADGKCNVDEGCVSEDSKITIAGGDLTVSKTDALPNETITITGNGFGSQTCIPESNFTLDNTAVIVDEESTTIICDRDGDSTTTDDREPGVEVSNSGQFVATIVLWPAGSGSNPTLIPGTHELSVEDNSGFGSSVDITIPEPTVRVTPEVAGPRDYITIIGENWPVDNPENPSSVSISVEVDDNPGTARARTYILFADAAGRITQEHRVHRNVAIPSTVQIKMTHAEVAEIGSFSVPASTIEVTPGEGQPGDMISLTAGNMPVYSEVDYVEVGGTRSNDPGVNTDRDGNVTVDDVLIPGLDPGLYSVVINVKGTIAIGEVQVLPEGVSGAATALPDAVADFGDNLDAIFHFDNNSKEWSFYDPRPEFAELNTLTELNRGQPYWVLVKEDQENVNWNNRLVNFTCAGGDCWNLEIW